MCRPEIGPKYFDKLKPEPGPSPARPKNVRLTTVGETPNDLCQNKVPDIIVACAPLPVIQSHLSHVISRSPEPILGRIIGSMDRRILS